MNNEPVAWTDGKGNYFDKNSFFPVDDFIPLYTHPVKEISLSGNSAEILSKNDETLPNGKLELTDKEIISIANQCLVGGTAWHNPDLDPIEFARAVIKLAQEK
jgi:hypothetical protein